jgi:natural product biosynthesis luciferase-like monooxygenase protein
VDFSLFYFADDATSSKQPYRLLLEGARFADTHGMSAVWTPERHFHPFGGPYPNPAVLGAAVAAVTEHVAIRAGSVVAPLHPVTRIAEEWSVVDNLSGGRVGIALASGWSPADFAIRPQTYPHRQQAVLDTVEQVRRLWRGEDLPASDGLGNPTRVRTYPRPVQPELPMWLTSTGNVETFRNAGRLRTGVLTHLLGQEPDRLEKMIAEYRAAIKQTGTSWPGHVVLMLHTFLGPSTDLVREVVREPFCAYLKSNFNLVARSFAAGRAFDPATATAEDIDFIAAQSFSRYFTTAGLFGTVDTVSSLVRRLARIGVDEIGCLIDFGVDHDQVLESLHPLAELTDRLAD